MPAEPLQVRVDVAEVVRDTLVGLRLQLRPVVGRIVDVNATVPVKPARLLRLIVVTAFVPTPVFTEIGLVPTMKSAG